MLATVVKQQASPPQDPPMPVACEGMPGHTHSGTMPHPTPHTQPQHRKGMAECWHPTSLTMRVGHRDVLR